jgi:hypothetical protein
MRRFHRSLVFPALLCWDRTTPLAAGERHPIVMFRNGTHIVDVDVANRTTVLRTFRRTSPGTLYRHSGTSFPTAETGARRAAARGGPAPVSLAERIYFAARVIGRTTTNPNPPPRLRASPNLFSVDD